jgi:tetratricopeptide (TPR) repeat protein
MKFFVALAILLLAGLSPAFAQQNADDQYINIYGAIQQADSFANSGQPQSALNQYVEAQAQLQRFQKIFPDWNPTITKFRLKYLAAKIAALTAQIPAPPANPPPDISSPSNSAANPNSSAVNSGADELASLRAQLQNLQSDNTMLAAKLKEALAAQPAMVDAGELSRAQAQIESLLKQNALLKADSAQSHPQTIVVADTNALALAQAQIQSLTQENESLKTNLAQEKIDMTNALTAAAGTLAAQTARADKLAADNGELQTRIQALLASPDSLAALHDENALLKKQLADLQSASASSPTNLPEADKLDSDLKAAKLQIATLQSDTQVKQLEMAALENRIEQLKLATNAIIIPPSDEQAENLAKIKELTQERDDLLGKLGTANKALYGAKKQSAVARIDELTDQINTLRARLAVDEAQAVPYSTEELALFKQAAPLLANSDAEKKSISELPSGSAELVAAAQSYFSAKQFDKAEANYLQILQRDEKNPLVLANLAAIELEQGKLDDADKHISAAVAQNPDDAYNLSTLGYLKFRQEKYDEALDALSRAAKLDPQNPEIQNYLGVTLSHKGLRAQAETALRKAIQLDPNYAAAHNNLAAIYISQTPPLVELARFHYQKALAAGQPRNPDLEKALEENGVPVTPP